MMRTHLLAICAVTLAGCGDDPVDLSGVYRVDSAVGSAPCDADVPLANASAFLRFNKEDLLGSTYYSYDGCADEAATDCTSMGGLFGGFYEPIDHGWLGVITTSSGAGDTCVLGYIEQTAVLDGRTLAIEFNSYREEAMLPELMCDPAEAEKRGDAMPCVDHKHVDATRL